MYSQGTAGNRPAYESQYIVSSPTAGVISKNSIFSSLNINNQNSTEFIFNYGIYKDLNVGIGLNINNLTGNNSLDIPKLPGISIKYRLIDEAIYYPAFLVGFSSQGRGNVYSDKYYSEPSPGFYLAMSKSFKYKYGSIFLHGGLNYSFENDKIPNYWIGLENSLLDFASINLEFNPYLNKRSGIYKIENPYLNLSFRASVGSGLTIEYKLIDLLSTDSKNLNKNFGIEFIRYFWGSICLKQWKNQQFI